MKYRKQNGLSVFFFHDMNVVAIRQAPRNNSSFATSFSSWDRFEQNFHPGLNLQTSMMLMKIIYTLTIFIISSCALYAQPSVTLNVSPRPNPYLSEWATRKETAIFTITIPNGSKSISAKFSVEIKKDGVTQAKTKFEKMNIVNIPTGVTSYYAEQLVPFNAVDFTGNANKTAAKTGMLPAGEYEFCVDLLQAQSGKSYLTAPVCRMFSVTGYDAPVLLAPENNAILAYTERPTFRWAAVSPRPIGNVKYKVQVFEVLQGQRTMQAFRVNQPILDRDVTNMTQLIWPTDFQLPGRVDEYVWTVRALDEKGNPIGEADGYAQPFSFSLSSGDNQKKGGVNQKTSSGDTQKSISQDQISKKFISKDTSGSGGSGNQTAPPDTTNYGSNNPQTPPSGCQPANTQPPVVTDQNPANKTGNDYKDSIVTVGFFSMKVLTASGTSSSLAGTGSILVSWLRTPIAVEFSGLKINAANQVYDGDVVTQTDQTPDPYQTQWAANVLGSTAWTTKKVKSLDRWLKANFSKLVKNLDLTTQVNNYTNTPVKLPLGLNDIKGYTIAIAEMKFTATGAQLVGVMSFPVLEHNDSLAFKVTNLFFAPSGPSMAAAKFGLMADISFTGNISNGDTYTITFKSMGDTTGVGTYVKWDCDGFRELNVDIDVAYPRSWLLPIPDDNPNKQVTTKIVTTIADWDDWIVTAQLPLCTIVGTNGTELEVQGMAYDHSDIRNPTGINFPAGYQGDTTTAYQGFFIKQATVYLPDNLRSFEDSARRVTVVISNVIINKNGVTGDLLAKNVLQYPKANIAKLGGSIDTVKISLVNTSVTTAYMRGKIQLPITDTTSANALNFKALFQNGNGFQFTLQPTGAIKAKLFADAKLTIAQTSSLNITLSKKSSFNLTLNGDFEWTDIAIGPIKNVKIKTDFQNVKLAYSDSAGMYFDIGQWSFASPPKWISNFPVTIEKIKFKEQTKQGNEVIRGALTFDVVLNLSENKVGGRTRLEVVGSVERPSGKKFVPKFIGARVDSIALYVKTSAVKMDGYIKLYQSDPVYGNGFKGAIKATFNSAQIEVSAMAMFGTTSYQSQNKYRYWYVDAKVILPPPGIVFLPGYAFYGFGAGAWQRINVSNMPKPDANQVASATSTSSSTSSGATFTPDPNVGFGFKLTAVLGTAPDASKCNADVSLSGQFSTNGGMINIHFNGEVWGMAKLTERASAPVHGVLDIDYNFPTKIFHLQAKVDINKDPISTPNGVNMVMHLEGKTGIWYVKVGEPTNRNIIKVSGINVESYFMFGKNITPPSTFSQSTIGGLQSVGVWNFSPDATATNNAISGNGFAAGIGLNFDTGNKDKHLFGRVYFRWRVAGGFEVNLSLLKYADNVQCASGATLTGVNKWYTQGSVAAYAIFQCGLHVNPKDGTWNDPCAYCCMNNHPNGCDFTLADIRLGAYLMGGFPKPTWLEGAAGGSFNVLGGLVTGSFTAEINYGSKCTPAAPAVTVQAGPAQDAAAEQETDLIKSISPANNTTHVAVSERPRVIYGFKPNESFDVIEDQGGTAGTTINRTFQARYNVKLQKKVGTTFSNPLQIKSLVNSLDEYIYFLSAPFVMQQQKQQSLNNDDSGPNLPAPDLGPNLDSNRVYQVIVTGTLYEFKNNNWVIAKKKNGQDVVATRVVNFTTVKPPTGGGKQKQQMIQE